MCGDASNMLVEDLSFSVAESFVKFLEASKEDLLRIIV